jgi:hypothetical protein
VTCPTYIKYYIDALPKFEIENEEVEEETLEKEYLANSIDDPASETPLAVTFTFDFEESTVETPPTLSHQDDHLGKSLSSFFLKRKSIISMRKASFAA